MVEAAVFRLTRVTPAGPRIVEVEPLPPPGPAEAEAIELFWSAHRREHPEAFSGELLSVRRAGPDRIEVARTAFRHWLAQRAGVVELGIRPLGVTGLLRVEGSYVLAQRSGRVTQDAGLWEFAPSGSLAPEARSPDGGWDPARQLRIEAGEELNLSPEVLPALEPVALVEDTDSRVSDLLLRGAVALDADGFERAWRARPEREYLAYELIPPADLADAAERLPLSDFARFCISEVIGPGRA